METKSRIPLPLSTGPVASNATEPCGQLVAEFISATADLTCEAVAALARVRPTTIRGWRRRLPRSLNAGTARRIRAHLTGEVPGTPEAGFQKVFRQFLRESLGTEV